MQQTWLVQLKQRIYDAIYFRLQTFKTQLQLPQRLKHLLNQGGLEVETVFVDSKRTTLYFRTYVQLSGDVIQTLPDPTQHLDPVWQKAWNEHYQQHQKQLQSQLTPLLEFKRALQSLSVALSSVISAVVLWWQDWQMLISSKWQTWLAFAYGFLLAALFAFLLFWLLRQALFAWMRRYA